MKNLTEVASFMFPSEADVLISMLQAENITYFLDDSNIIPGVEARLLVNSDDLDKTIEIIKQGGFEKYLNSTSEE